MQEVFPEPSGRTVVFAGDGTTWRVAGGRLWTAGVLRTASPDGYGFDDAFVQRYGSRPGPNRCSRDTKAVASADVVYTDV
jgi:ornithine carbamoyltransferase